MIKNLAKHFSAGKAFKDALKKGSPKYGLFLNSGSPVVAEQLSYSSYDWLLVDSQHGPMTNETMHSMIASINNNKTISMVRVQHYQDRGGIQQALDAGANGILVPQVNNREEVEKSVYSCIYPVPSKHKGSRSIYFP